MRIMITGGHLIPALAVIDKILTEKTTQSWSIGFVGHQFNPDQKKSLSLEYQEIKKRPVRFFNLTTGRLYRELSFKSLKNLFLMIVGLIKGWQIVNRFRPAVILSFGGYLGFPIIFWGWIKKIPIFCHEQTLRPGFANRLTGFFAKKILVAFPETKNYFPAEKVLLTGNPIRRQIFEVKKRLFKLDKKLPVIYVTGGSLGSHSLNLHLQSILIRLLKNFIVIHQTGNIKKYQDFERLNLFRDRLPANLKERYFIREHFFSSEIGYVFSVTDLVVSRAGANTVFELMTLKKPAVLVPLPWSINQEQQHQAAFFASHGLGEVFSQFDSSERLFELIKKVYKNLDHYQKNFNQLESIYKKDATSTIIKTITSV